MTYPNGQWPSSALAAIPGGTSMGGTAYIAHDLLPGLVWLQTTYEIRWGTPLRPTSPGDGYRSYQRQVNVFLERYEPQTFGSGPYGDVRYWTRNGVRTRYVRVRGASAAVPGTSNHGHARAVDFSGVGATGGARWSWLMDNAPRFGWVNPEWARDGIASNGSQEPWHWEGVAVPVSNYRTFLAGLGVTVPDLGSLDSLTPITPEPEDDEMPTIITSGKYGAAILDGGRLIPLGDQATVDAFAAAGAKRAAVTDADFLRLRSAGAPGLLIFNAPESGGRGWAYLVGDRAVSVGDQALVDALRGKGVPDVRVGVADFDRLTAASVVVNVPASDGPTAAEIVDELRDRL